MKDNPSLVRLPVKVLSAAILSHVFPSVIKSNFSWCFKHIHHHTGHENVPNDHQREIVLIFETVLRTSDCRKCMQAIILEQVRIHYGGEKMEQPSY